MILTSRCLIAAAALFLVPPATALAQDCAKDAAALEERLAEADADPAARREADVLTQAARAFAELENLDACRKALAEAQRVIEQPRPTPAQAAPPTAAGVAPASSEPAAEAEKPAPAPLPAPTAVYFASGAAGLDEEATRIVASAAESAAAEGVRVKLRGFTDASGSRELNQALSRKRVENVAAALRERGVPAARIDMDWRGVDPESPDSGTGAAARKSRRVEIELVR